MRFLAIPTSNEQMMKTKLRTFAHLHKFCVNLYETFEKMTEI